jgi:hypothetical protein
MDKPADLVGDTVEVVPVVVAGLGSK